MSETDSATGQAAGRSQRRELLLLIGPALLAVVFAFWFAYQFVEPAPPSSVTITTGSEKGGYYAFAQRYREILAKSGIELKVLPSEGSTRNIERLRDEAGQVQLALLQGGISDAERDPGLVSLGRVFLEPVWIFHNLPDQVTRLTQLAGKRIAIGPQGSGTRVLAQEILRAGGVEKDVELLSDGGAEAAAALREGRADAIVLVTAPESKLVRDLLREPQVKLMSFKHAEALTRIFPFLSKISLPSGVIDLSAEVPPEDVSLVAAKAALVARENTHPAIVGLLVQAAKEVHREGGIFQGVDEFPKSHDPEFPMHEDAERLYTQGPPFLQRYLPFWLANFIERMFIMLVPVATILVPLFNIVPWLYEWRLRQKILHWYAQLKELEREVDDRSFDDKSGYMKEIDRIEAAVSRIPIPLHYSDKLYELRGAVEIVRNRIAALPGDQAPPVAATG